MSSLVLERQPALRMPPALPALVPPVQAAVTEPAIRIHDALHPGAYGLMFGCFGVMMLAFGLTFLGSPEALFSVTISAVYLVVYLGTPMVMLRVRAEHAEREANPGSGERSFAQFLHDRVDTATGPLSGWEAVTQACGIPFAVMLATIGICIVIATT